MISWTEYDFLQIGLNFLTEAQNLNLMQAH